MEDGEKNPDVSAAGQRKAKTHKGRRHLDKYKPRLREDDRQCILVKGNKTSDWVTKTMQYLVVSCDSSSISEEITTRSCSAETKSDLSRTLVTWSSWQ